MKTTPAPVTQLLFGASLALACLLTSTVTSQAKDHKDDKHDHGHDSKYSKSHHDSHDDDDRRVYSSRPRSSFVLSLGTGYAGRGYYYGPANSPYYYERPDVRYYSTREAAPREYYSRESYRSNSTDAIVQEELARRGYYHGSVDGEIGPQSRRALARYQQDRGLQVTGTITSSLLRSLGI